MSYSTPTPDSGQSADGLHEIVTTPVDGRSNQIVDDYWGLCPECGTNDGYLNVGRCHWFKCDKCQVKWCVGSNLFSSWQDQTDEDFEKAAELLACYKKIEPAYNRVDRDRAAEVAGLLSGVDQHLTSAWQEMFWAKRKGVTLAEATEHLRLPHEFLIQLRHYATRRMADAVWFKVQEKQA